MRSWFTTFLLVLLVSTQASAFTTKKLDPRSSRPVFKASPSVTMDHSSTHSSSSNNDDAASHNVPVSTPVFAFANPAVSMAPSVQREEYEDDDELIGYGAAVVSCVISLALGYTLGYAT